MGKYLSTIAFSAVLALSLGGTAFASGNGSGTDMPAYYDCEVHTVNFKPVKLDPNTHPQVNNIYVFPKCTGYLMVIDQITGGENTNPPPKNGFNPLWQLVNVTFNNGICPSSQFDSGFCTDALITTSPDVTLTPTGMTFRCSVVGPTKSP